MTAIPAFNNAVFDPSTTKAMGHAFDYLCGVKPKVSRELIANRIIQLAKAGERDAIRLSIKVMDELAQGASADKWQP
jgi:hypothetical protein